MRIVSEIFHPQCKITVFAWNGKYLIKLERGLLEQTYKIPEMDLSGEEDIKKLVQGKFLQGVLSRFDEMEKDLLQALHTLE